LRSEALASQNATYSHFVAADAISLGSCIGTSYAGLFAVDAVEQAGCVVRKGAIK